MQNLPNFERLADQLYKIWHFFAVSSHVSHTTYWNGCHPPPANAMPPVPVALPSDVPPPTAIVVETHLLPCAATLPKTVFLLMLPCSCWSSPCQHCAACRSASRDCGHGPGYDGGQGRDWGSHDSNTGHSRCQSGVWNYQNMILIDIIEDIHPVWSNGLELVAKRYLEVSREDDPCKVMYLKAHLVDKLCNKFKNFKLMLLFPVHLLERKRGIST